MQQQDLPSDISFVLTEKDINKALGNVRNLFEKCEITHKAPRGDRDLTGLLEIPTEVYRDALINHARQIIQPHFTHIDVEFSYSRLTNSNQATIHASTQPIVLTSREARSGEQEEASSNPATTEVAEDAKAEQEEAPVLDSPFADDDSDSSETAVAEFEEAPADKKEETLTQDSEAVQSAADSLFSDLEPVTNN